MKKIRIFNRFHEITAKYSFLLIQRRLLVGKKTLIESEKQMGRGKNPFRRIYEAMTPEFRLLRPSRP